MPDIHSLAYFGLAALLMVLTPGPNMIYLISRSICQGKAAGFVSLLGVIIGFFIYMLSTVLGITALFVNIPYAYWGVKIIGAAYLLWLSVEALTSPASPFSPKQLPADSKRKLFQMGLLTNLLNPKVALFYMSLFPQFIKPQQGSILVQSLVLGFTQILISFTVNFIIVMTAGGVSEFFQKNPRWLRVQKWIMGLTLAVLAVRLIL